MKYYYLIKIFFFTSNYLITHPADAEDRWHAFGVLCPATWCLISLIIIFSSSLVFTNSWEVSGGWMLHFLHQQHDPSCNANLMPEFGNLGAQTIHLSDKLWLFSPIVQITKDRQRVYWVHKVVIWGNDLRAQMTNLRDRTLCCAATWVVKLSIEH